MRMETKPAGTTYTIRSEGGSLTAPGSDRRAEAMAAASALARENEGQRIIVYRNGKPVRTSSKSELAWTSGPRAEVQR